MQNFNWKRILLGIVSIIGIFIILMLILGSRFQWNTQDLPESKNMSFGSTCNYYGIWYEKWNLRIVVVESCMNI